MYRHAITTPVGDRIKLRISFDAEKMLAEYKILQSVDFEYYDVIPLRTTAHQVDTSLPFPPPAKDCADGCYTDWLHTNALRQSAIISVVDFSEPKLKLICQDYYV